jgi:RNA polymerase sigma-70 factor (ECF subfamily)
VLAPDVIRRADPAAAPPGAAAEVHGAQAVAEGTVGVVVAPGGQLLIALTFTIDAGQITAYGVIADPARLRQLDIAVLDDPGTR